MSTTGAVYDRGYRPYEGELGGRGATRWALWRLTVRRALGLRRSWRQKVLPWTLLGLTMIPAAIDVGVRWLTRDTRSARSTSSSSPSGSTSACRRCSCSSSPWPRPDVICPDRHDRVLPLIFARPLTGDDYVLAKVGGIFSIVFGFSFLPRCCSTSARCWWTTTAP